ncbi:TonB-dependent receptor plug domain-containing protein [Puia sp. P3]|uniref:TonB-dependent receptor plug domain-containing protein n=1 Tax=Puia sp. P3 TaxID=3423952 RepID=UPI003D66AA10
MVPPRAATATPPTILVRGVNTLGNTNPLYIIDGVPTTRYEDFANLNAATIASIQVLKDASASSIYGSRASNGVIIVTTKDGSTSGDKLRLYLNPSVTWQTERPWQEKVLNSADRGRALWRAAVNDGTDPNNLVNQIYTYDWNNDFTNPVLNKVNIAPFVGGSQLEPVGNTNWQNELYKTALITTNDLGITAGNSRNGVSLDFGYLNNSGLLQFTNYKRYNARINSHVSGFNNRLRLGENFQLSRTTQVGSARTPAAHGPQHWHSSWPRPSPCIRLTAPTADLSVPGTRTATTPSTYNTSPAGIRTTASSSTATSSPNSNPSKNSSCAPASDSTTTTNPAANYPS